MNKKCASLLLLCGFVWVPAQAGPTLSPAEVSIRKAQGEIEKHPDHAPYYNALAMAYARRARETSDVSFYEKAEETVDRSLSVAPGNFEALKVRAWLLLGKHEFAKALELATDLNKKVPDDVTVYGYLTDANVELGNYSAAIDSTQWMLNMKPGNIPGLTRAAYLRELHGNLAGALDLMRMAYDSTSPNELEDRAWILTQMAHLHFVAGDGKEAEIHALGALELFPDYHYALGVLAQIRMSQKRFVEAVALLEKRYAAAPHAENLFSLAEALSAAGRSGEAAKAYAEFERKSLSESGIADNSNHELISYYVDVARQPEKALEIARREMDRRHDLSTRQLYAWALAANGDISQAREEMQKVVAIGVKDPTILEHAAKIFEQAKPLASR